MLLLAALDFKSQCEFEGMDWKSKRPKDEQLIELMMKQYPMSLTENYQNENLSEDHITEKHISIQTAFRKAADAGQKSDGSRVVFIY